MEFAFWPGGPVVMMGLIYYGRNKAVNSGIGTGLVGKIYVQMFHWLGVQKLQ